MPTDHPLIRYRNAQTPRLSRQELAAALGVDRQTVWRWERRKQAIDRKVLPKVSEVTGISRAVLRPDLAELMGEAAE